jgi:peptidoglycan/xylan/chitin deacetylase (PgdA/CDA1 family)
VDSPLRWRAYLALQHAAGVRRRLPASSGTVALTFDDGPDPESTPRVLDLLAEHGVPATFFCVGYQAQRHPALVRRIAEEGHAVGSHSQTHRIGGLSPREAMADFVAGRRSVEDALGRPVPLFRPPHGWLEWRNAAAMRRLGLRTWLWTVDPEDYAPGTKTAAVRGTVGGCRAGDVVLMHDGLEEALDGSPDRSVTIDALPEAIAALRARGLRPVALG